MIQRTLYLHRGVDLVTDKIVRQDKDIKEPLKPFVRQIVYLQGSKKFKESWTELIEAGGGEAIKAWFRSKCCSFFDLPPTASSLLYFKITLNWRCPR